MLKSFYVVMFMGLLELSQAQRPSYAGLRPPGGLSQRDKYHAAQHTAVENFTGVDFATRFGGDAVPQQTPTINLDYGATQRPPVGVPLIFSDSSFVPVAASAAPTASVDLANRISGTDSTVNPPVPSTNTSSSSSSSTSSSSNSNTSSSFPPSNTPVFNALPIDARGDQDYVNRLNGLPVDNQPFWFLNYQAIEALRNNTRPNVGAFESRGSFFAG